MVYDPRGGGGVHHDQILTQISVDWINEMDNAASALFPRVTVPHQTDKYYVFDREHWKQPSGGDYRAPASEANETPGRQLSDDSYYCKEHSLQHPIPPEERANATAPVNPDSEATEDLTGKIGRGRELMARDLATDPTNYLPDHVVTLSGTDQLDQSGSDAVTLFRDLQRTFHLAMGTFVNTMVVPWRIWSYLQDHAEFRERVKYVQPQVPSTALVAQFLEVGNIVVPGGRLDNARYGQEPDISYLWGNNIVLAYVPPAPSLRQPAFGYEFVWPLYGGDMYVDRWWNDDRKTDLIRVGRSYDLKLVAKEPTYSSDGRFQTGEQSVAGMLIQNVIADDEGMAS